MALSEHDIVKGLEVVTQDAYILGRVMDIRFEDLTWSIQGFKVKTESKISKIISVSGKSMILLQPGKYTIADVVLMPDTVETVRLKIAADTDNFRTVSSLIGNKVVSQDDCLIGIVDSIQVDLDNWTVVSMKVKLDKTAYQPLEIKKGLFGKKVSGLMMTHISDIAEGTIKLNLNTFAVKSQIVID